jgi:hypothetical protein
VSISRAQCAEVLLAKGTAWIVDKGITKGGVSESDGGMLYTGRVTSNWGVEGKQRAFSWQDAVCALVLRATFPGCEISGISEFSY